MTLGLVGRKCGMSRVFTEDGKSIPVTIVEATPNQITQIKTSETDGYAALQVTAGAKRRASRVTQPIAGHVAKAGVEIGSGLWEFRVDEAELTKDDGAFSLGGEIKVDIFEAGQMIDVTGTSKGKGFAGVVKRHHFRTQDATHGNSLSHRAPGSIGQNQSPGRVFKGKKMAGQLGNVRRTIQGLTLVDVDVERNLLIIKGSIPGANGGHVLIKPSVKDKTKR